MIWFRAARFRPEPSKPLNPMEKTEEVVESIFAQSEQYSKTSIELFKLKAIDKAVGVISSMVYRLVVIIFFTLFFFIVNIGLSFWLGELIGHDYLGFFIVAGFYLVVGVTSHFFLHRIIVKLLVNFIISQDIQT